MVNKKTLELINTCIEPSNRKFYIDYCNKFDMKAFADSFGLSGYVANPIFKDHFDNLPITQMLKYFTGTNHYTGRNVRTVSDAIDVSKMHKDHTRYFKAKDYDLYFFVSSTYGMWSFGGKYPLFEQAKFLVNPIFFNYIGNVDVANSFGAFGTYYGDDKDYRVLVDDLTDKLGFVPFWNCE